MEITKYVNSHVNDRPKYAAKSGNEVEMTGEHLSSTVGIQDCEPCDSEITENDNLMSGDK